MKKLLLTLLLILFLAPQAHAKKLEEVTKDDIGTFAKASVEFIIDAITFPFRWLEANVKK